MISNIKNVFGKVNIGFTFLFIASAALAQTTDSYTSLVGTGSYNNFKISYSPEALNIGSATSVVTLRTRHSGLSQSRIKVFVPPGAKTFRTSIITYAVSEPARAAARFALPPVSLVTDVVPDVNGGTDTRQTLENLQNGQELRFYSPEKSGVLMVATANTGSSYQSSTGGYIYINFFNIPGGSFMSFDTQVEVEKTCYQNWYNGTTWNASGNPRDEDNHTCTGSGGGSGNGGVVVPTTLTGIALSASSWKAGAASNTITVTPEPVGATLPACNSSNTSLLGVTQASNGQSAVFTVNANAVTDTANVTVTCGTKSATLNLQPAGTVAVVNPEDVVLSRDENGKAQLAVTVHHTDAEAAAKATVDYWVAALIPSDLPFFGQDEWFFLSSLTEGGYQWKQLENSFDVGSVSFQQNGTIFNKVKKLTIPLGFEAAEFKRIGAKIYLVYSQKGGDFREVGVIWNSRDYVESTSTTSSTTTDSTETSTTP